MYLTLSVFGVFLCVLEKMLFTECRSPQHGKLTQKKGTFTRVKDRDSQFLGIAHLPPFVNISSQNKIPLCCTPTICRTYLHRITKWVFTVAEYHSTITKQPPVWTGRQTDRHTDGCLRQREYPSSLDKVEGVNMTEYI